MEMKKSDPRNEETNWFGMGKWARLHKGWDKQMKKGKNDRLSCISRETEGKVDNLRILRGSVSMFSMARDWGVL